MGPWYLEFLHGRSLVLPGTVGLRQATLTVTGGSASPLVVTLQGTGTEGYYQFSAQGRVDTFGDAASYGDVLSGRLNKPIVGMAATGDDGGYWLVASDGGIFNYGDADFFGSTGGIHLNQPIVGHGRHPRRRGLLAGGL